MNIMFFVAIAVLFLLSLELSNVLLIPVSIILFLIIIEIVIISLYSIYLYKKYSLSSDETELFRTWFSRFVVISKKDKFNYFINLIFAIYIIGAIALYLIIYITPGLILVPIFLWLIQLIRIIRNFNEIKYKLYFYTKLFNTELFVIQLFLKSYNITSLNWSEVCVPILILCSTCMLDITSIPKIPNQYRGLTFIMFIFKFVGYFAITLLCLKLDGLDIPWGVALVPSGFIYFAIIISIFIC